MAITTLLADDHQVLRDGLRLLLQSHRDLEVIGVASDGLDAIRQAERLRPDVVVMDVSMPNLGGIEATQAIISRVPQTGVVMLSMHSSPEVIHRALRSGARGFLLKESAAEEIVAAVRAVAAGARYLGQGASFAGLGPGLAAPTLQDLTHAEREILRLVAEGNSSAETARHLGLSTRTVETYRGRLMQKLRLEHLPALVKFAIRNGVVSVD
jgi:DNA-binding NarL/FixJ family response regulator